LPLQKISTFENVAYGFNKKVLLLHTSDGDQKIGLNTTYQEWETALKEAMKRK
jgi:hypothetical protein